MTLAARVRALLLLGLVLDRPVYGRVVRALTPEPVVEETEIDGVPVEIVRPAGSGPWPAWLFVNGAHPLRRREPVVTNLSRGLARAGFVVFVPDIPGLGEGTITQRTAEAVEAVVRTAAARADVRGSRVALVGASTGAGLALRAAGRPEVADCVSVVAAVAPFADLRKLVCLVTTSAYEEEHGFTAYEVTPLHRRVVARSLVAALPDEHDRTVLLAALDEIARAERDPLEELPRRAPRGVSADAAAVLGLLGNREPDRFAELYAALPEAVRAFVEDLSPLTTSAALRAPVEVVVPPFDVYFPLGEALALGSALPDVRVTVTRTLDHTRPQATLRTIADLAAFEAFVVRGLAAAAR
jgi:acetyl esterase/lipase